MDENGREYVMGNMDFTLRTYKKLIKSFLGKGYVVRSVEDYLTNPVEGKVLILRHDVDELAGNALRMARLENELGVRATYFFRIVKQSNVPEIITEIKELGHEIGYHYEDLTLANGDFEKAITTFKEHLEYFRRYYPVKTVCMHGSSASKYDNRLLWDKYNLSDFQIIGEPYITLDFNKIFYITDTGYCWDGGKVAVRDHVDSSWDLSFHTSDEIIESSELPDQIMMLAHTLWTDSFVQWMMLHLREFLRNNVKQIAKNNRFVAKYYEKFVKLYWSK